MISLNIVCQKMAPHGKQMTPEEKQIIVALSQQGYSIYKIAEMRGKNRRTISKLQGISLNDVTDLILEHFGFV
jgi:DNA-binding CsgD family transcriptional regulator